MVFYEKGNGLDYGGNRLFVGYFFRGSGIFLKIRFGCDLGGLFFVRLYY